MRPRQRNHLSCYYWSVVDYKVMLVSGYSKVIQLYMCVSHSVMSGLFETPWTKVPLAFLYPWNFPGKEYWVGSHFSPGKPLLTGISAIDPGSPALKEDSSLIWDTRDMHWQNVYITVGFLSLRWWRIFLLPFHICNHDVLIQFLNTCSWKPYYWIRVCYYFHSFQLPYLEL